MSVDSDVLPKNSRKLRACMLCSLVKGYDQFYHDGCSNCEPLMSIRGSADRVYDCTTTAFSGLIAMMKPTDSWVGRWQRLGDFVPGLYAIKVMDRFSEEVLDELARKGVKYVPRDE